MGIHWLIFIKGNSYIYVDEFFQGGGTTIRVAIVFKYTQSDTDICLGATHFLRIYHLNTSFGLL